MVLLWEPTQRMLTSLTPSEHTSDARCARSDVRRSSAMGGGSGATNGSVRKLQELTSSQSPIVVDFMPTSALSSGTRRLPTKSF